MSAWTDLFAELRRVYNGVSTLLLDSDRCMAQRGFKVAHGKGNQIGIERSGDLHEPDWWAPAWVARFYRSETTPPPGGPILYVGCMLSDSATAGFKLPEGGEPVLTAGILEYDASGDRLAWYYWLAKSWFWHSKDRVPDGQWVVRQNKDWHKWGITQISSFALPLVSLTSRVDLEERVFEPLFTRIGSSALLIPPGASDSLASESSPDPALD